MVIRTNIVFNTFYVYQSQHVQIPIRSRCRMGVRTRLATPRKHVRQIETPNIRRTVQPDHESEKGGPTRASQTRQSIIELKTPVFGVDSRFFRQYARRTQSKPTRGPGGKTRQRDTGNKCTLANCMFACTAPPFACAAAAQLWYSQGFAHVENMTNAF